MGLTTPGTVLVEGVSSDCMIRLLLQPGTTTITIPSDTEAS
jgi:hypothetical protein